MKNIKTPKSLKIFLVLTIIGTLISLLGNVYFINAAIRTGVLFTNNLSVWFVSLIGCVGMTITELIGIREYKEYVIKRKEIASSFKQETVAEIKKENEIDYSKVTQSFINHFSDRNYPSNYSVDLLYKIIFGMRQSGYTKEEISEYIVNMLYEEKNEKTISKKTKMLTKIKYKI